MNRLPTAQLSSVAQTLLIPLYYRVIENKRADALLRDPFAEKVLARLDVDMSWLGRAGGVTQISSMLRMRKFDRLVTAFLQDHPKAWVIEMGCGLDTRPQRLSPGGAQWLLLDLPEVIELREQVVDDDDNVTRVGSSIMDFTWLALLEGVDPRQCFFISEGVFTYLQEAEVHSIVVELAHRFPGSRLAFDGLPLWPARIGKHPALRKAQASINWGLGDPHRLEAWAEGIRLIDEWFYCYEPDPRLKIYNLVRFFPPIGRGPRVVTYQLGG